MICDLINWGLTGHDHIFWETGNIRTQNHCILCLNRPFLCVRFSSLLYWLTRAKTASLERRVEWGGSSVGRGFLAKNEPDIFLLTLHLPTKSNLGDVLCCTSIFEVKMKEAVKNFWEKLFQALSWDSKPASSYSSAKSIDEKKNHPSVSQASLEMHVVVVSCCMPHCGEMTNQFKKCPFLKIISDS